MFLVKTPLRRGFFIRGIADLFDFSLNRYRNCLVHKVAMLEIQLNLRFLDISK